MLIFFITWLLFATYSFTRLDLNLILYRFDPLIFQQLGFYHRPIATLIFIFLCLVFTLTYLNLIKPKGSVLKGRTLLKWAIPISITGILAYPMFSYDLFNYLFNAKMVLIFKANPHLRTAMEFSDPMLRFMRNIHTPAPYAYGWTAISLIPGLAWFLNKFTLSFWAMKTFVAIFWLGELAVLKTLIQKVFPKEPFRWWLFALSPLVLIETLIIGHNDVVMMLPALLSFLFLLKSKKILDKFFIYAIFFLTVSASIKYATIILLPFYLLIYLQGSSLKVKKTDLPTLFSWALLAIMFIRPGQLHSWYLIWAFSFVVLSKSRLTISIITALTIGALLRYAPYIYYGSWDPPVYFQRNLIWVASLLLTPFILRKIKTK
ncbi:MAG: hypothetical protein ABIJ43_04395 [Candidatus Beckwithbacteria bacterium]